MPECRRFADITQTCDCWDAANIENKNRPTPSVVASIAHGTTQTIPQSILIVKLRSRSRSGEGQVRVRKVRVRSGLCELKDLNKNLRTWT